MAYQPKVFLSPFVLATASYDNANSIWDQEGFLIGKSEMILRPEISDTSMNITEEHLSLCIYSCIPSGSYMSFYDNSGKVNSTVVNELLGERKQEVIGWYRFRRNVAMCPSARELKTHKSLQKLLGNNVSFGAEYFLFAIFGAGYFPTNATLTVDHAFFILRSDNMKPLEVILPNLGSTKAEYRNFSASTNFVSSGTFHSVLTMPWDMRSQLATEDVMSKMHQTLRDRCDSLVEQAVASESVNCEILQDIHNLERELELLTTLDSDMDPYMDISEPKVQPQTPSPKNQEIVIEECEAEYTNAFGKYFGQNQLGEKNISSAGSSGARAIAFESSIIKKKIKVQFQERKRELDHDFEDMEADNKKIQNTDPQPCVLSITAKSQPDTAVSYPDSFRTVMYDQNVATVSTEECIESNKSEVQEKYETESCFESKSFQKEGLNLEKLDTTPLIEPENRLDAPYNLPPSSSKIISRPHIVYVRPAKKEKKEDQE